MAFAVTNWNYRMRYRNPGLARTASFEASPDEVARLALASAAPAQEALNVAYERISDSNVTFLGRNRTVPASTSAAAN